MTPQIILAFANDKDNYLEMISREHKSISRSLRNYDDKGFVKLSLKMNTSIEDLFETFTHYRNQIQIFHYGGHANGTYLQLEQGGNSQLADAGGLADLIAQQTELKLVFLNGCATKKQVELLLKKGVKSVIATSVPINDTMAVEFAEQFYQALANQASLGQAFATARAFVSTKYGDKRKIAQFRDIEFTENQSQDNADVPWGLYLKQENSDVLDWKLPKLSTSAINVESEGLKYKSGGIIHKKLIETLVRGLPEHDEDVRYMLEKLKKDNNEENKNNVYLFIVNSFPTPIGLQIRKLFANKAINPDRLQQLMDGYRATIELICFIMLSQLWDEKVRNPKLKITEEEHVVFHSFFSITESNYKTYNYYTLLIAIQAIFKANYLTPYINEIGNFDFENPDLLAPVKYMQELKTVNIRRIPPAELERLCIEAEENFCSVLGKFLFVVKYKFVMVKNIELIKERHEDVKYKHTTLLLKQVEGKSAHESSQKLFDTFSDNKSVIVSRTLNTMTEFLNLSPFIIDENSLLGESETKLFYFSYSSPEEKTITYRFLDGDDFLEINDNKHAEILRLMEKFKNDFIGEELSTEGVTIQPANDSDDLIDSLL